MNRPDWRLHLGRECYSTKQIRCNQFRENKLHPDVFSGKQRFFAPFRSKHDKSQKKMHQGATDFVGRSFFPIRCNEVCEEKGLHPVAPLDAQS
jgi:hypothetical protein